MEERRTKVRRSYLLRSKSCSWPSERCSAGERHTKRSGWLAFYSWPHFIVSLSSDNLRVSVWLGVLCDLSARERAPTQLPIGIGDTVIQPPDLALIAAYINGFAFESGQAAIIDEFWNLPLNLQKSSVTYLLLPSINK